MGNKGVQETGLVNPSVDQYCITVVIVYMEYQAQLCDILSMWQLDDMSLDFFMNKLTEINLFIKAGLLTFYFIICLIHEPNPLLVIKWINNLSWISVNPNLPATPGWHDSQVSRN